MKIYFSSITKLALLSVVSLVALRVHAAAESTVTATGQAAIYGTDIASARDKATSDALRKAVEQAAGTMVSSETVTQNFELISDKIFSKAKGYVSKYNVVKEGKEDGGIYAVTVQATVAAGNLEKDLNGVLQMLRAKNMPRVLLMVAEQNVGQGGAQFWWGDKTFSTNLDAVENSFMDAWIPKGVKFVDRQALQGKLSVGPALSSAEPSDQAIKEFAGKSGAELVIIGKAVATDVGPIMGTQMHSVRANISLRALNLDSAEIIATATLSQAAGHIDPTTGGTQALKKVAEKAAEELLKKILDRWQTDVHGASTVKLVINNVKKSRNLRDLAEILKTQVRGVQEVRQRSYEKKSAELEVELKGSAQNLADELEDKKFPGFEIEIEGVSANTVTASVK